ncbi:MAG TPA: S1-like domain-containing RNA-binding protein [Salinivirgaceae bacterium]|nr:S1-like domain-containing RNA-binding protein [Salinivirgaceae bacterium]
MALLGHFQKLQAVKITPQGFYLSDNQEEEILLPNKFVPENLAVGDEVEVFVYKDSEDRVIATTQKPLIEFGRVAVLEVVDTARFGAFLEWGLDKHLLLPHREQIGEVRIGQKVVVILYIDIKSKRLAASEKIDNYLTNTDIELQKNQKVNIIVYRKTPLGYSVIIENRYIGLVHLDHTHRKLDIAEQTTGYVSKIRPDNKIDIILNLHGYQGHDNAVEEILEKLKNAENGFLPFNDNSSPEEIDRYFNMSKKLFKKSIGTLYKKQLIRLTDRGIELKATNNKQ